MLERPLTVLHVIPSLYLGHGGPSYAMRAIETALLAVGVDVETATTDDDGIGRRNGKAGKDGLIEDGVRRRYFRKTTEFYKSSVTFAAWALRSVDRYDVVHIHALFSFTSVAAAFAATIRGVPYVIRPLGTLSHYGIVSRRPWLKRLSLACIERPILRRAAAIHFTSEMEREAAQFFTGQTLNEVIPLAVAIMSGTTPCTSAPNHLPVLPKPLITSSAIRSIPYLSQSALTFCK